jgi:hypothetical protein
MSQDNPSVEETIAQAQKALGEWEKVMKDLENAAQRFQVRPDVEKHLVSLAAKVTDLQQRMKKMQTGTSMTAEEFARLQVESIPHLWEQVKVLYETFRPLLQGYADKVGVVLPDEINLEALERLLSNLPDISINHPTPNPTTHTPEPIVSNSPSTFLAPATNYDSAKETALIDVSKLSEDQRKKLLDYISKDTTGVAVKDLKSGQIRVLTDDDIKSLKNGQRFWLKIGIATLAGLTLGVGATLGAQYLMSGSSSAETSQEALKAM